MSCLSRIIRLSSLKSCVTVFRNITSTKAPVKSFPTNNILLTQASLKGNWWIYGENDKKQSPIIKRTQIDFPNGLKYVLPFEDPKDNKDLELPTTNNSGTPKEAARLIVIRRRKMKRHKLKKLRKKMKFEWAKRRQRREWNKEKVFQAELIQQCKEGEAFDAEKYVEERLAKYTKALATPEPVNRRKSGLLKEQ